MSKKKRFLDDKSINIITNSKRNMKTKSATKNRGQPQNINRQNHLQKQKKEREVLHSVMHVLCHVGKAPFRRQQKTNTNTKPNSKNGNL